MNDSIRTIRELDRDLALLHDRLFSLGAFQTEPLRPDPALQHQLRQQLTQLNRRIQALPDKTEIDRFFIGHFTDYTDMLSLDLEDAFEDPGNWFSRQQQFLKTLLTRDQRRESLRFDLLLQRHSAMRESLALWQQRAETMEKSQQSALLQGALEFNNQIVRTIGTLKPQWAALAAVLHENSEQLQALICHLQQKLPALQQKTLRGLQERLHTDPQQYRRVLKLRLGVDLDDLLGWYEEEMDKTRSTMMAIASRLAAHPVTTLQEVRELLDTHAGPCSSAEEMFERGHRYLRRVREACAKKLWLPLGESCELTGVPEELRESFPWGGYMNGCPYERPIRGRMFLNETNFTAVSDGWIKVNTIHEAYFGHHLQFVHSCSDPILQTMKGGPKADPIIEGTAHRSERVYESIFAEDPYFPLFTALRRHHTAVRIKADLMLRLENRQIGEVVELYQKELGFDERTARGQVLAQENMFGYFTCYCYGLKKIEQLEAELRMDPDSMTAWLMNAGQISIESLALFLRCSEESRYAITHDYPSLFQFA